MSQPTVVAVTGASGYVASELVKQLLEAGYTVHGTVRSKGSDSSKHLSHEGLGVDPGKGKLVLFEADLLTENSFDDAFRDAVCVFHTASPFLTNKVADPAKELIEPAVRGTENVLGSVVKSPATKFVVLTSSVVSIYGKRVPGKVYTSDDWNEDATLEENPYPLSKVTAERRAWEIQKEHAQKFSMCTVNPGLVMGPSLSGRSNDGSVSFFKRLVGGEMWPAV